MAEFPEVKAKVDEALAVGGLAYDGKMPTKHLLEVIVDDVGLEKVRGLVKQPLKPACAWPRTTAARSCVRSASRGGPTTR